MQKIKCETAPFNSPFNYCQQLLAQCGKKWQGDLE